MLKNIHNLEGECYECKFGKPLLLVLMETTQLLIIFTLLLSSLKNTFNHIM